MASVDVTVRGGGIFGLSIAWACVRRGVKVRLIETARIGGGCSGGLVGALAPHAPEAWSPLKQFQFESLIMAEGWWATVAQAGGVDPGYLRSGRLQPLADEAAVALAQERIPAAAELWQGLAEWRVVPATGAKWEPASPSGWLIHDTLTARLSPRQSAAALEAALRASGAEIVLGEAPEEGAVVHATGLAGLQALSAAFGRKLGAGVKGQALKLRFDARDMPQVFAAGVFAVPHADGTVAVGSTAENVWTVDGPDGQLDDVLARAVAMLPVLAGAEVQERWAGVRPRAKSRGPVLGAWPGRPGHFVANGGFKIGFGVAPKVAEVMADLVLEGRDVVPDAMRVEALLA
ncbi:FAD-binding oxidoreductase [Rhodobacter sp. Har01]|uniref:NAD(P)/FAD-dependent oxidoreductase n=1 Tax=Rhodobacter sp. Har01 TaxID=2883999 RepID=UPI001D073515|nr:FAD-dependent oxidoreductase [Rhodobacter sp. Har01]MCB6179793.1 FAD-binding oxidoreductase [Rhodobacter sp. Har01]